MSEPTDTPHLLLRLAADDEFMARSLLPIQGVTDAGLGFHCQQAVEKALKSVLALNDIEYPFSHDLDGLLKLCQKHDIEIPQDLHGVGRLSIFAVRLRYDASPAAVLDREQALKWSATAVAWARTIIEKVEAQRQPTEGTGESE